MTLGDLNNWTNLLLGIQMEIGIFLERSHYEASSTNIGLLEANRTAMRKWDLAYDWVERLFLILGLPIYPSLIRFLKKKDWMREKKSEVIRKEETKGKRIAHQ